MHGCSGAATKTAWMTAVMSAPDVTPPLAAAASALVIDGEFRLGQRPVDARGTGSRRTARCHLFLAPGCMAKEGVSAGTVPRDNARRWGAVRASPWRAACTCRRRRRAARGASCFEKRRSLRDGGCLSTRSLRPRTEVGAATWGTHLGLSLGAGLQGQYFGAMVRTRWGNAKGEFQLAARAELPIFAACTPYAELLGARRFVGVDLNPWAAGGAVGASLPLADKLGLQASAEYWNDSRVGLHAALRYSF